MCNMQELYLHQNQIGDAGLSALAKAVGKGALASLEVLFLENNQIRELQGPRCLCCKALRFGSLLSFW